MAQNCATLASTSAVIQKNERRNTGASERRTPTGYIRSTNVRSCLIHQQRPTRVCQTAGEIKGLKGLLRANLVSDLGSFVSCKLRRSGRLLAKERKFKRMNSQFHQDAIPGMQHARRRKLPLPRKKYRVTFGDIWGHLGTYVPLSHQNERNTIPIDSGSGPSPSRICTRTQALVPTAGKIRTDPTD